MKIQQYAQEHLDNVYVQDETLTIQPSTMALLTKLAELDIYEIRCNALLAKGDKHGEGNNLLSSTVEAINDKTGDVIWGVKEHPIFNVKEKLSNQREKILKALVATPEAKVNQRNKNKMVEKETSLSSQFLDISKKLSIHGNYDNQD
jgi:hypothetical protein